jgi:hypothetical protein
MNLWFDFSTNDNRLVHKWRNYFPVFERHFQSFIYKSSRSNELKLNRLSCHDAVPCWCEVC